MDAASASLCQSIAERLRPLYRAVRAARLDSADALLAVYDEAVLQVARARNDSEIKTKSVSSAELQEIMNLVMA